MKRTMRPASLDNVTVENKGDVLLIGIDLSKSIGPSKSGKSNLIATTHGIMELDNGVQLSVTAFKKIKKAA